MSSIFKLFCFAFLANFAIAVGVPQVYILHINGIDTTRVEAYQNLVALQNLEGINSNIVKFNLVWNPTGKDAGKTTLDNFLDVLEQKLFEGNADMSFEEFVGYYLSLYPDQYPPGDYSAGSSSYLSFKSQMLDDYAQMLKRSAGENYDYILDEFHQEVPMQFASVLNLLGGDKADYSTSPNYVLLVPHSQGNLYANGLYTYLTNVEHFNPYYIQIFGIATPADKLEGNQILSYLNQSCTSASFFICPVHEYITSTKDFVIGALTTMSAQLGFSVLPPNITLNTWGHSLVNVYLSDDTSKDEIRKSILDIVAYFTVGVMNPEREMPDAATAVMRVEMQGPNNHVLTNSAGAIVCSHGICPGSDGFIQINNNLSEYFFATQYGYHADFDKTQDKNLMHINCQDFLNCCRLMHWQDCDDEELKARIMPFWLRK